MNSEKDLPISNTSDSTEIASNIEEPIKKKLPLFCKIMYAIAALCLVLYILFVNLPELSDFFNRYISSYFRGFLAKLTGWIPFSLAELLLLCVPIILIALVSYGIKHYSDTWRNMGVFCLIICTIGAYVFASFTIGFVPAYRGTSLDKKMGLDKKEVSAEELRDTALLLSKKVNAEIGNVMFDTSGASVMPYSYEELNDKLMYAYKKVSRKYDFLQDLDSSVKRIMLSEPMTYTHISGVYTFFTGEANLNTNFPPYTQAFTAAHELAHQRGIAREDEANFVAFLVCMDSNDSYLRYCAYLNMYEYVSNALYSANTEYFSAAYSTLPQKARGEMAAYSKFFEKYRDSVASDVSGVINDTYINLNGDENGTKSYGMVVDLAVAYYKKAD